MITIHNTPQGTEKWHIDREGRYTGSNAYKLLGMFGASEYAKAKRSAFVGNFYTKRGHRLENQAIALYERIYNTKVARPGYFTNDAYPDCLYSPDGVDTVNMYEALYNSETDQWEVNTLKRLPKEHVLLEVKCFVGKSYDDLYNNGPDIKILAQIHFGMVISGLRHARLIIFNPRYAKKYFEDENGVQTLNPDYNPQRAIKVFEIRRDVAIQNNFKRILA
jgi:hypothetical protein